MSNPFEYKRQIWAYDWRMQAEQSVAEIAWTMKTYNFDLLQQEFYYGMLTQGNIDGLSPKDESEFIDFCNGMLARGITVSPVVLPLGDRGEAELHGSLASKVPSKSIVVDIEWDQSGQYWHADGRLISVYFKALRDAVGPDVCIVSQPDGRIASRGGIEWQYIVTDCAPYVDLWMPQVYSGWPAYGTDQATINADVQRVAKFLTIGLTYSTLYTSEVIASPTMLWQQLITQFPASMLSYCAFRLGAMDATRLAIAGKYALPEKPIPPTPTPEPVPSSNDSETQAYLDEIGQWIINDAVSAEARGKRFNEIRAAILGET